MRWYVNDLSLQGQFDNGTAFVELLQRLIQARARFAILRSELRTSRTISERSVTPNLNLRNAVLQSKNRPLLSAVLLWLDRQGPFLEDDRLEEVDDYFECCELDATDSGLGEAARRVKFGQVASTFSFEGTDQFCISPLMVFQGLMEERLGTYSIENTWDVDDLSQRVLAIEPVVPSWRGLVEAARVRFSRLIIPDAVFLNPALAKEPFEAAIRDRALTLLSYLNAYMEDRSDNGAEGPIAREILTKFFVGERALFSGESSTNQRAFKTELTFLDPENTDHSIFAHWHGKISHRFFRLHFEWPVPADSTKLKILYLGPKLTKS